MRFLVAFTLAVLLHSCGHQSIPQRGTLGSDHPNLPATEEAPIERAKTGNDPSTIVMDLANVLAMSGASPTDVLRARERYQEVLAREDRARSQFLPDIIAGVGFAHHVGQIQATEGPFLDVTRQVTAAQIRAQISLPLANLIYDGDIARTQRQAAEAAVDASILDSMLRGAMLYFDLLVSHEDARIARGAWINSQQILEIYQVRMRSGNGIQVDVDRALAKSSQNEAMHAISESQIQRVTAELVRHLRLRPGTQIVPSSDRIALLNADDLPGIADAMQLALHNNPRIRALLQMTEASDHERAKQANAHLLPKIHISAGLSELGENPSRFGGSTDFQALLGWEFKGLGMGTVADIKIAESKARQVHLDLADERERVAAHLTGTLGMVASLQVALRAADQAVFASGATLSVVNKRLEHGNADSLDALIAEEALVAAQQTRLRTVTQINKSILQVKHLLGESPVP